MKLSYAIHSLASSLLLALQPLAVSQPAAALPVHSSAKTIGSACGKWVVVKSADGPSSNNHLYGVSASAANNVWAVGNYELPNFGPFRTLTERWNGTTWNVVPSANAGAENGLSGVAVISPTDVWAVGGFMAQDTSPGSTLIEHWNGQKWSVVPSPHPGQLSALSSVRAVSAADVWAVGFYYDNVGNSQTLIEHWNGRKWSIVPSPSPGSTDNGLGGLTVISASDIWTAGDQSSDQQNTLQTLIEQWDGKKWTVVPSPNPGSPYNALGGMTAVSAKDIWAVGEYSGNTFVDQTLAEHWDGNSWKVVPTRDIGPAGNVLFDVYGLAGTDVWAVGYYFKSGIAQTLVERWDGTQWSIVHSPNPGKQWDQLQGITRISNTLWSVGNFESANIGHTLVESLCH